ncbi:hypothetical protein [Nonomuraea sp. NPDC050310]|uniref:hypothetical protein n=1 Tax=Nonomuraea sp. NPDC050310 TaxID=3154935 RepID=UPI0033C28919
MIHPRAGHDLPPDLAALQADYPDWSIWEDDQGRPWATRLTPVLTKGQEAAGMDMTITPQYGYAPTADNLRDLLQQQVAAETQYRSRRIA